MRGTSWNRHRFFGLRTAKPNLSMTPGRRGGVCDGAALKSQAHEGWKLIRNRYDDDGYSGGSMERPALHRRLDDVRARRIDVVVVY
jgi:Resolvase, N terminal domain